MNSARVVQISDCHLLADEGAEYYGVDTYASLSAVCDAIASLDIPPDVLLVTGDHAEDGSVAAYRRSLVALEKVNAAVFTLPGNHDNPDNMRRAFADSEVNVMGVAEVGAWRVITLNSQLVGHAHGFVDARSIEYLHDEAIKANGTPVAVALHHSPVPECESSGCHIQNNEEFLGALKAHDNIRLVVSGHVHKSVEKRIAHTDMLTTPSTFAQVWHAQNGESEDHEDFCLSHKLDASRHGYRIIDLCDDGSFRTEVCWVANNTL